MKQISLSSSEDVSYDILKKYINLNVKIEAVYTEQMPSPYESYPMEMDINGKSTPMTRKFYRVISIKPMK